MRADSVQGKWAAELFLLAGLPDDFVRDIQTRQPPAGAGVCVQTDDTVTAGRTSGFLARVPAHNTFSRAMRFLIRRQTLPPQFKAGLQRHGPCGISAGVDKDMRVCFEVLHERSKELDVTCRNVPQLTAIALKSGGRPGRNPRKARLATFEGRQHQLLMIALNYDQIGTTPK